jgi:thioredoxin 1
MDIQLEQKDFQETIKNNKKVLIDFYADWFGPCQTLLPTVHNLAEEFDGDVSIKKVNVDHNSELAAQFGVRSIPTLVYLSEGKEINRQNGVVSENDLRTQINELKSA